MTDQLGKNPDKKEMVVNNSHENTGILVVKTIVGVVMLAIAFTLIFNGLKNLSSNSNDEINNTDNLIEQSLNNLNDTDFSDNLDIEFNDTSTLPINNQIDQNLTQIDNSLKEINNQSDFKDIDSINFNQ